MLKLILILISLISIKCDNEETCYKYVEDNYNEYDKMITDIPEDEEYEQDNRAVHNQWKPFLRLSEILGTINGIIDTLNQIMDTILRGLVASWAADNFVKLFLNDVSRAVRPFQNVVIKMKNYWDKFLKKGYKNFHKNILKNHAY